MIIANGAIYSSEERKLDTDFTFFRGKMKSQNDLTITNNLLTIGELHIKPKMMFSDHCPISISCNVELVTPMEFIYEEENNNTRAIKISDYLYTSCRDS